ncbi:MAG: TAXI family TRAP transporter solute-binding subunit [Deltaproteobacteria bacterium]|nr:TAXI family TRAP transporter solute-binding subunit [Deltaproteobacteria bacterium]
MKKLSAIAPSIVVLIMVLWAHPAWTQAPKSATLATHAVGSLYHSLGTGVATVLSRRSPMIVRVQPFAGPPAWLPSMDKGETDMGLLTSADAALSSKGVVLYKKAYKNTRIVSVGGLVQFGFYVRKDAPMETVADLKGKRIPTDFPGIPIVRLSTAAVFATAGLTFDDMVKVPVSDLAAAAQAFLEGRTDAGWTSPGTPAAEEANARVGGIRFLSVVAEGARRLGEIYPGSYASLAKAGAATGLPKDALLTTNDVYLIGTKQLQDEAVYEVVKVLWENNRELGEAFPALRSWTRERMVSARAAIPYHPGAIKFFKEKGMWSKEMETLQAMLSKQ